MRGEDRHYVGDRAKAYHKALEDEAVIAAMRDMAVDQLAAGLIQGRITGNDRETMVHVLESRGTSGYDSVAIALGRQHFQEELADSAARTARRIRAGLEPYDRLLDQLYPGFSLLFGFAAMRYSEEVEGLAERMLAKPAPTLLSAVRRYQRELMPLTA